jgi:hypothetical protein
MQVKCEHFGSGFTSWETLCAEAAAFATSVGRENLISISVSEFGEGSYGSVGSIFVWYWE